MSTGSLMTRQTYDRAPRLTKLATAHISKGNVTLHHRRTLLDSAGLPPGLYATNMRPYNKTHSSLGKATCAPSDDIPLLQLCTHNASELIIESTHRTLPTQLDHTTVV